MSWRRFLILAALPAAAGAQQATGIDAVTDPLVISSAQTGGTDTGPPVNDPTSLTGRGGAAIRAKTYQETIGTPIGTPIGSAMGRPIGVPH